MSKAIVEVRGNIHLIDNKKGRIEVEESVLGDLGGLEKCFGFTDYKTGTKSGLIIPHTELIVYRGFVNPDASIVYSHEKYFAVDEIALDNVTHMQYNPRTVLNGINWWYILQQQTLPN